MSIEIQTVMPSDTWGLRSNLSETRTCCQCHHTYKHYNTEITYRSDFDDATFCSYNCRSKYYKEHKKERKIYLDRKYHKHEYDKIRMQQYEKKRYQMKKSQEKS